MPSAQQMSAASSETRLPLGCDVLYSRFAGFHAGDRTHRTQIFVHKQALYGFQ